ncbi:fimbria/pilus outer membrane usher protein, partial [Salmonella enterica subsp. enterica serovar Virginia]|nr:fimbria/pilus outer membrane usher protein [Salmonella enterica subsp. enterica serovar Virginia]
AQITFEKLIDNYTRRGKKTGDPIGEILTECSQNLKAGFSLADHLKYSLSAGEYRAGNYNSAEPKFGQLDAMYGLPYGFTVYGGA